MSNYDNHRHNADPAYTEPSLRKTRSANDGAGKWIGLAAVAILAVGAVSYFAGAFDEDETQVAGISTERVIEPETSANDALAPTDGAAVVVDEPGTQSAIVASDGAGGAEVITMPNLVQPKLATPGDAEYVGPVDEKRTVTDVPATD